MFRPKFKIGDWVRVSATVSFFYADQKREMHVQNVEPWIGQIVGARRKQLGTYVPGCTSGGYFDDTVEIEPAYLQVNRTVIVWLVTRGIANTPQMVLEENLEAADIVWVDGKPQKPLPWLFAVHNEFDERVRQELRDAVKDVPRDAKGRFVKC